MRNETGRNKTDVPSENNPKTGTAGRKTRREATLQHTGAQRETMRTGLRILARIIARAHLERQLHLTADEE